MIPEMSWPTWPLSSERPRCWCSTAGPGFVSGEPSTINMGRGHARTRPITRYLKDALDDILAGRPIAVAATNAAGCLLDRVDPKIKEVSSKPRIRPATPALVAAHEEKGEKNTTDVGEVDYATAAARIIQNKCQSCHRPGQVGPFSLASYDDARKACGDDPRGGRQSPDAPLACGPAIRPFRQRP